jgi:hypothetical protein
VLVGRSEHKVIKEGKDRRQLELKDQQGLKVLKDLHLWVQVDQSEHKVIKVDKDRRQSEHKEDKEREVLRARHQLELKDLRVLSEHKGHLQSVQ